VTSINIVKWWTLLLIMSAIVAWVWFLCGKVSSESAISGLLVVTLVALDVLQPCTDLWLGDASDDRQKAKHSLKFWWRSCIQSCTTGLVKWLGPLQQILMLCLIWVLPSLGLTHAFLLVIPSHQ